MKTVILLKIKIGKKRIVGKFFIEIILLDIISITHKRAKKNGLLITILSFMKYFELSKHNSV